jgi:hypothetical protein
MAAKAKRSRGQPTAYKPEYAAQATKLCGLGATDADVANFFEVAVRTIYRWSQANQDFCQALKVGKEVADERVRRSLYRRACGFEYEAVKVFLHARSGKPIYAPYIEHVTPDTTAAIFWLKNRDPDNWRDQTDHKHSGKITLDQMIAGAITPDATDAGTGGDS